MPIFLQVLFLRNFYTMIDAFYFFNFEVLGRESEGLSKCAHNLKR